MFIPYEMLDAVLFAAEDSTRYAINGVQISRGNTMGHVKLAATDGRRMIHIEYDDTAFRDESPLIDEVVSGFSCVLSRKTVKRVRRYMRAEYNGQVPRNAEDHTNRCVQVCEQLTEDKQTKTHSATITLRCGTAPVVLTEVVDVGKFPDTGSVIPEHTTTNSVSFGISPELLGTSANVLHKMQETDDKLHGIIGVVPLARNKPITLYASRAHPLGGRIRSTVVIMPIAMHDLAREHTPAFAGKLNEPSVSDGNFDELLEHAHNLVEFVSEMPGRADTLTVVAERLGDRLARFEGYTTWDALTKAKEKVGALSHPLSMANTDGCDAQ